MIANQEQLSDMQLEDLLLSGARGLHAQTPTIRAEQVARIVSTPARRLSTLDSLLSCARELSRRRRIRTMQQEATDMTSPGAASRFLIEHYDDRSYESFLVLFVDAQHRLIAAEEMFRGTLTQTSVYPREVVKRALELNAAALLFSHNHPSGVAEPSRADEFLTTTLKSALALVDVRVLDHIVVAGDRTTSFAERGLL